MRNALAGVMAGCLLAGCGQVGAGAPMPAGAQPTPTATLSHGAHPGVAPWPGAFLVRYGDTELSLAPFTYCYSLDGGGICVDGFDDNPPSIGAPDEVLVFVPVPEFDELTVTQSATAAQCDVEAEAEPVDGGWWVVRPRGPAGDYVVSFFASGNGGDMVADVVWRTPPGPDGAGPCR